MGKQFVPEEIGKEVGVKADLRKSHPNPREAKSQKAQIQSEHNHGTNKRVKISISQKVDNDR